MLREREIRNAFDRSGYIEHYRKLKAHNAKKATLEGVVEAVASGANIPDIEYLDRAAVVSVYWAFRDTKDDHKPFLYRLMKALLRQNARQLLIDESYALSLARIAKFEKCAIREPEDWRRPAKDPRRQFSSLLRHLFCKYKTPAFLERSWHQDQEPDHIFFVDLAWGTPVYGHKRLEQVKLTRKMAHYFTQAPENSNILTAVRWAQVKAAGGNRQLYRLIAKSMLGQSLENNDFWAGFITWLTKSEAVNTLKVREIIDFIAYTKFGRFRIGETEMPLQAPEPDFKLKGRSYAAVQKAAEKWREELRLLNNYEKISWTPAPIPGFQWFGEPDLDGRPRDICMMQLLTNEDVVKEGKAQNHCVGTYIEYCRKGQSSIWSLRLAEGGKKSRLLTVEVDNEEFKVEQVKRKNNELPTTTEIELLLEWASHVGLEVPEYALA